MDAKKLLIVDAVALAVYAVAANPSLTGIPLHEWAGIAVLLVLAVHVAQHFDWAVETARSATHRRGVRLAKLVLDALLVLALMVCCVSGLMVSATVLQALGLYATGWYFWDPLHAASAKMLLALLLVHAAVNWKIAAAGLGRGRRG